MKQLLEWEQIINLVHCELIGSWLFAIAAISCEWQVDSLLRQNISPQRKEEMLLQEGGEVIVIKDYESMNKKENVHR